VDSFEQCRISSEKAAWSFEKEIQGLQFDFKRAFLPNGLVRGVFPDWMNREERLLMNQIRGFSYAHIFLFVEQFIIEETCAAASTYLRTDREALSALLKFADEETKHQKMFIKVKDLVGEGLNVRPKSVGGMEDVAEKLRDYSPFSVFLCTLHFEWITQQHYVEFFQVEKGSVDADFMKIFRLHWTEEAQHARIDALQLRRLAGEMESAEIISSYDEFWEIMLAMRDVVREQDRLDLQSFELNIGRTLGDVQRKSILDALEESSFWVFFLSGLRHKSFSSLYKDLAPEGAPSLKWVEERLAKA
jgi:hypothetical protein